MQNIIDQANKNRVELLDVGHCQFCGSQVDRGAFECLEIFNNAIQLLNYKNEKLHLTKFLGVDAHALQHPEIHGRWSNHFHLTRLNLILDKKVKWTYKLSPLLSEHLKQYKITKQDEILIPPPKLYRGKITAKDLSTTTTSESVELVNNWAKEVYQAWGSYHKVVSDIADNFLANH